MHALLDSGRAAAVLSAGSIAVGDLFQAVVLIAGALAVIAVGRSKRKDTTITDYKEALEGCRARADNEHELRVAAERSVSELTGRLQTLERYAAPEAFREIASALARVEAVMGTAIHEQGELVMKNTELVAGQTKVLERLADDLSRLAERLGSGGDRPADIPR
jgi:hypothetical protein